MTINTPNHTTIMTDEAYATVCGTIRFLAEGGASALALSKTFELPYSRVRTIIKGESIKKPCVCCGVITTRKADAGFTLCENCEDATVRA